MRTDVYEKMLSIKKNGAGYFCLIDPDKQSISNSVDLAINCEKNGADVILIGGSLMLKQNFLTSIKEIKKNIEIPVVIFPGIFNFVSPDADALLLLSMLSSRNPQLLIGEQVRSAPLIRNYNLESIGTAYLLIDSGNMTSVQYMSNSLPIPNTKNDIAVAHALAGEYLGMKMIYLEAGSGAKQSVPESMISAISDVVSIPIIVGGGITKPEIAYDKVVGGADFVVTGTVLENGCSNNKIKEFSEAIHEAGRKK